LPCGEQIADAVRTAKAAVIYSTGVVVGAAERIQEKVGAAFSAAAEERLPPGEVARAAGDLGNRLAAHSSKVVSAGAKDGFGGAMAAHVEGSKELIAHAGEELLNAPGGREIAAGVRSGQALRRGDYLAAGREAGAGAVDFLEDAALALGAGSSFRGTSRPAVSEIAKIESSRLGENSVTGGAELAEATVTRSAEAATSTEGPRQTMGFGREWYDNFVSQYGPENIEWTGGSGRTVEWPSELPVPEGPMYRVSSPSRSSKFVSELESVSGARPPDSVAHHVKPLMCNGADCGKTNAAWTPGADHTVGHNKLKPVERLPIGTEVVVKPPDPN
jgi:hypothetical protein